MTIQKSALSGLLLVLLIACNLAPPATLTPTLPPATATPESQLVDVGGHKLWIECQGAGSPVVILDAGLGVYSGTWHQVAPRVGEFTRVCRYDRAGMGQSSAGPKPRTSQVMVEELHALLTNAGLTGPYILVGHSLAGLNIRLFASLYPQEVAGLIFVDAIHPDLDTRLEPLLTPELVQARRDELELNQEGIRFEDILTSEDQVRAAGPVPEVPLIVIRHGLPFEASSPDWPSEAVEELWAELQANLATLTPYGKVVVAENSQHRIQETEPEVVTAAINEVVATARK